LLEFRQLECLAAVIEAGSIQAAAYRLNISQPALSKIIKKMELQLGVTLLNREPRGVTPTEFGALLYRNGKVLSEHQRRLNWEVEALKGLHQGLVSVGVGPVIGDTILPEAVAELRRARPSLRLRVIGGSFQELCPALKRNEIDVLFSVLPDPLEDDAIQLHPLRENHPCIMAREDHPLAGDDPASLERLAAFPWLLPEYPKGHEEEMLGAFLAAGIRPPKVTVQTNNVFYARSLILATDMLTIMPRNMRWEAQSQARLAKIRSPIVFKAVKSGYVIRARSSLSPGVHAVIATFSSLMRTGQGDRAEPAG
jgi:DNA-binding transcriptional LysR family regulator